MRRIWIGLAVVGLAACGQQQGGGTGEETAAAPSEVSAPAPVTTTTEPAAQSAGAQSCLDLVAAGSYAAAIDPCTQALAAEPGNASVQSALDTAKTKVAEGANAGAGAAAEQAQEAMPEAPKLPN